MVTMVMVQMTDTDKGEDSMTTQVTVLLAATQITTTIDMIIVDTTIGEIGTTMNPDLQEVVGTETLATATQRIPGIGKTIGEKTRLHVRVVQPATLTSPSVSNVPIQCT